MASLGDVFRELNAMRDEGIVGGYAIGGAMGALFYLEVVRTYDVDVFALIPSTGLILTLSPLYEWARARGFEAHAEHILMHGVPVQFLAVETSFDAEAVSTAQTFDYDGVAVAVMRAEYLTIYSVLAGGAKRRARAAEFLNGNVDHARVREVLQKHALEELWTQKGGDLLS